MNKYEAWALFFSFAGLLLFVFFGVTMIGWSIVILTVILCSVLLWEGDKAKRKSEGDKQELEQLKQRVKELEEKQNKKEHSPINRE